MDQKVISKTLVEARQEQECSEGLTGEVGGRVTESLELSGSILFGIRPLLDENHDACNDGIQDLEKSDSSILNTVD